MDSRTGIRVHAQRIFTVSDEDVEDLLKTKVKGASKVRRLKKKLRTSYNVRLKLSEECISPDKHDEASRKSSGASRLSLEVFPSLVISHIGGRRKRCRVLGVLMSVAIPDASGEDPTKKRNEQMVNVKGSFASYCQGNFKESNPNAFIHWGICMRLY